MYSENEWVWWLPFGYKERVLIKLFCNDSVFPLRWNSLVGNVYNNELSKATDEEIVLWNLEN